VEINTDDYSRKVVDTARRAMEILDEEPGEIDAHAIICRADKESAGSDGITGFMAGGAARLIAVCHSRGDEFNKAWNKTFGIEDDTTGTVNPAIMTIGTPPGQ